jgi:hypothetical protein
VRRFPFEVDDRFRLPLRAIGVRADRAFAAVTEDGRLVVSFGWWLVDTPVTNIAGAEVTGPFRWYTAIGPRGSLADRGVTFGTATTAGVCLRFVEPLSILYGPLLKNTALTVTVAEPHALVTALDEPKP